MSLFFFVRWLSLLKPVCDEAMTVGIRMDESVAGRYA